MLERLQYASMEIEEKSYYDAISVFLSVVVVGFHLSLLFLLPVLNSLVSYGRERGGRVSNDD